LQAFHVIYEDIDPAHPFPFSESGIKFLRNSLLQDTIVLSDDLTSEAFVKTYVPEEIGARALHAGIDVLLLAGHENPEDILRVYNGLIQLAETDEAVRTRIFEAAENIIQTKKNF